MSQEDTFAKEQRLMKPTLNPELDEQGVTDTINNYYFSELPKIKEIALSKDKNWEDQVYLLGSRAPLQDLREEKPVLYDFANLNSEIERKISLYGGITQEKIMGVSIVSPDRELLGAYTEFKKIQEDFFAILAIHSRNKGFESFSGNHDKYAGFKKGVVGELAQNTNFSPKAILASPFIFFRDVPELTEYVSAPLSEFLDNDTSEFVHTESEREKLADLYYFNINMLSVLEAYSDNELRALRF